MLPPVTGPGSPDVLVALVAGVSLRLLDGRPGRKHLHWHRGDPHVLRALTAAVVHDVHLNIVDHRIFIFLEY